MGCLVWGMTVVPHCCRLGPSGGEPAHLLEGLVGGQWEGQSCPLQSILDGHPLGSKRNAVGSWAGGGGHMPLKGLALNIPHHQGFESPAGGRGE